jgi:uroporphyrinogen-III synthase
VVTLVPAVQRATGLLAELPAGTGRVLVVQAVAAEPTLADGLVTMGWQVTAICPYRSRPAHPDAGMQLAALSADAVLFASGSAARAWVDVFGTTTPPIIVAIGPQTARAVAQAGLKVTLVASDHSVPGLVAELERHLAATG